MDAMLPIPSAAHSLSPLTAGDVAEIEAQTRATLADLLTTDALAANTLRAYASALRYWDAWHRAAFGAGLPLLDTPRRSVTVAAVRAFVAHHTPVVDGDTIHTDMPEIVRQRLAQLGAVGQRQASKRDGHVATDTPTLATVRHRLAALSACHRIANIAPEWADDSLLRRALRALGNRASKRAPALLRKPKRATTRIMLDAMLRECLHDGLRGLRDAALLHVAFHTGGRRRSELVQMHWSDLEPLALPEPVDGVADGYLWTLREMKGKRRERADGGVMEIPILGAAAVAVDRYRDALLAHGHPLTSAAWWRVRAEKRPEGRVWVPSTPMIGVDVWHILRYRASQIGMNPAEFGAHSLRSGGATTFLQEGGSLADASSLLGHAKLDTTRQFYDRRGVPVAAIARLVSKSRNPQ